MPLKDALAPDDSLAAGDPEVAGAVETSQMMAPVTTPFVNLARALGQHLVIDPLVGGYQTTERVLGGQGFTPEEALNVSMLPVVGSFGQGGLGAGIRTYHGSPHDFPAEPGYPLGRFKEPTETRGTGSGGMTFGTGLYSAEAEPVAETYLSGGMGVSYKGRNLHPDEYETFTEPGAEIGLGSYERARGDVSRAHKILDDDIAQSSAELTDEQIAQDLKLTGRPFDPEAIKAQRELQEGWNAEDRANYEQAKKWLTANEPHLGFNRGHMYEVDIQAEPHEHLDWDKPFTEQSEYVQKALQNVAEQMPKTRWFTREPEATLRPTRAARVTDPEATGAHVIGALSRRSGGNQFDSAGASQMLKDAGIKGIRYLDEHSRAVEVSPIKYDTGRETWGVYRRISDDKPVAEFDSKQAAEEHAETLRTRNYVTFDPALMDILRKYGIAGLFGGGGAMALGASQAQAADSGNVEVWGDSLGVGLRKHFGTGGYAHGGDTPETILGNIKKQPPDHWNGKTVVLPSGSNGEQMPVVKETIEYLKGKGANVIAVGYGPKFPEKNRQLREYAGQLGVPVVSAEDVGASEGVHPSPRGYSAMARNINKLTGGRMVGGGSGTSSAPGQAGASAGGEIANGGAGREGTVSFWVSKGAPKHVAEGIADRVGSESGFSTTISGDKGTSIGMYQDHLDRKARLMSLPNWQNPMVQHENAYREVTGGDAIATAHWKEILAAPDRKTAAFLWDKYFERSAGGVGGGGAGVAGMLGRSRLGGGALRRHGGFDDDDDLSTDERRERDRLRAQFAKFAGDRAPAELTLPATAGAPAGPAAPEQPKIGGISPVHANISPGTVSIPAPPQMGNLSEALQSALASILQPRRNILERVLGGGGGG